MYKVHADIRGGSSWRWRGRQMRVGLSTTAIFGDLNGYFFGNFRDRASNIIWRYAATSAFNKFGLVWFVGPWLFAKWM